MKTKAVKPCGAEDAPALKTPKRIQGLDVELVDAVEPFEFMGHRWRMIVPSDETVDAIFEFCDRCGRTIRQ